MQIRHIGNNKPTNANSPQTTLTCLTLVFLDYAEILQDRKIRINGYTSCTTAIQQTKSMK